MMINRSEKKKVAIIGASYLQVPLIECAKKCGYETHVFAWECGDIGEKIADHFYPISIVEKDRILEKCREIGISGVCSIASDLAVATVNYIADAMNLTGNSIESTGKCTNKHFMRRSFEEHSLPSPQSIMVDSETQLDELELTYPVIVKPVDRSGSRGIFELNSSRNLAESVETAITESFEKKALIETFVDGIEYSVEFVSYHGKHQFLALTYKYTTGSPHFIEKGHLEPGIVGENDLNRIKELVEKALDSLEIVNGASHSEIKIDSDRNIWLIEIGARMGGDLIGSHLVRESTGIDMVKAVLQICMGEEPDLTPVSEPKTAGIRYIFDKMDLDTFHTVKEMHPEILVQYDVPDNIVGEINNSSQRQGYYVVSDTDYNLVRSYMPDVG